MTSTLDGEQALLSGSWGSSSFAIRDTLPWPPYADEDGGAPMPRSGKAPRGDDTLPLLALGLVSTAAIWLGLASVLAGVALPLALWIRWVAIVVGGWLVLSGCAATFAARPAVA